MDDGDEARAARGTCGTAAGAEAAARPLAARIAHPVPGARALAATIAAALAACSGIELSNPQSREDVLREGRPLSSAYAGWRVFQERCAGCHGADAAGTAVGPDLLPRLRTMGERRFTAAVLDRYEWPGLPPAAGAPDTRADEVMQRRLGTITMPAWRGEPVVQAHIADLYGYLSARAEGRLAPGRPER